MKGKRARSFYKERRPIVPSARGRRGADLPEQRVAVARDGEIAERHDAGCAVITSRTVCRWGMAVSLHEG
ncbi:MAG TPA: hypothetical protein VMW19_14670 [Myxococcota bacterium]|nr:hypothetical protein [Myxococcota bacterium]